MKNLFFLFAFMGFFAFTATAQTKACCAKGASKSSCSKISSKTMDKAASVDASIVKQVANDGEVSYTRKAVCPTSGKVSFTDVEYCTKSDKFVNVSPSGKKAACSKKASATKVSSVSAKKSCGDKAKGKACCAKGASKASCSSKGKKSKDSKAANETGAKVKLVSESANQ